MFDAVEARGADDEDEKARLVQQFMVCAEARYVRYLALLDEYAAGFDAAEHGGTFNESMPLPPWYPDLYP